MLPLYHRGQHGPLPSTNCGTTREGEVDLVHPLKAGFEQTRIPTHKSGFGPELKASFGCAIKVDFGCAYIRLGRCVNLGLKDHQNHLLVFKKMSPDQSRRWQLIGIKFTTQQH